MNNKISKEKMLLEACQNNVGEWVCSYCNTGSGQPAATFRGLKKLGYAFEEIAPNRWAKKMKCPHCNAVRSHYKLLSKEPLNIEKHRCTIPPNQRERVLKILGGTDAFTGSTITSTPEIDHKIPWSRLEQDINISTLTDEDVSNNFQLLTREHNLLKDRNCQHCIKYNERLPFFGIDFYYEGDKEYKGSCVGCGWYDGIIWRKKLNEYLNGNNGNKIN